MKSDCGCRQKCSDLGEPTLGAVVSGGQAGRVRVRAVTSQCEAGPVLERNLCWQQVASEGKRGAVQHCWKHGLFILLVLSLKYKCIILTTFSFTSQSPISLFHNWHVIVTKQKKETPVFLVIFLSSQKNPIFA